MVNSFDGINQFHFIGIGGIGMSGLAQLLLSQGLAVTGSDLEDGTQIQQLKNQGAVVHFGHQKENLGNAQVIVYSSAIPKENPELGEAKKRGLVVIHRSELLSELMRFQRGITVTGSHGKTTTTALITQLLIDGGLEPRSALGANLKSIQNNAYSGTGDFFVAEADESDRSFLNLRPIWTVVTNVDSDHLDEYQNLNDLVETFTRHMNSVPFFGKVIACLDDAPLKAALRNVHRPVLTYGLRESCDFSAREVCLEGLKTRYQLYGSDGWLGEIKLGLAGVHNVQNSVAAAVVGLLAGLPFSVISRSLEKFQGVQRRLEWKGERNNIWIFDDYGHHPSEIQASLSALRSLDRRLIVVFQPHRFTRTQQLINQLDVCFKDASELFLMDIYPAGESPIEGISSRELARRIKKTRTVLYVESVDKAVFNLNRSAQPGDLILTLGAGDVWKVGEVFLRNGQ